MKGSPPENSTMAGKKGKKGNVVLGLSIADMKHEWILTVCIILAITAVLSPLLLLFGLKYGIIDWGRSYLKEDPRYREIRPLVSRSFEKDWFEAIREQLDIEFIVPMTRQISASVDAQVVEGGPSDQLNIVPTNDYDPLLLENGAPIPGSGECVLSHYAAEAIGAQAGDALGITASRIIDNQYEFGKTTFKVAGILSPRAGTLKDMYVRLEILEAVENFKDGRAVPEFGWEGAVPKAYPVYNGLIVLLPEALSKTEVFRVYNRSGFTRIEPLDKETLFQKTGFRIDSDDMIYHLFTLRKPVEENAIDIVGNRLRGREPVLIPVIEPVSAELLDEKGALLSPISIQALTHDRKTAEEIGMKPSPFWENAGDTPPGILKIMISLEMAEASNGSFQVRLRAEDRTLVFPVIAAADPLVDQKTAFVPPVLGGVLNLFLQKEIEYDETLGQFVLGRRGYAGFRMYARSIYDVDAVRKHFEALSIPVNTRIADIQKVMDLDRGMSVIFWLLAVVAIAGSVASLVASLYASVERKRKEISILRLIGLSGSKLFRFPVYQGVLIGTGGFICSYLLFLAFSELINTGFRSYAEKMLGFPMKEGVDFCRLPALHVAGVLLFVLILSTIAATIAAIRATRIDPADALRDE